MMHAQSKKLKDVTLLILDLDGTVVEFPCEYFFSETKRILQKMNFRAIPEVELHKNFEEYDYFKFFVETGKGHELKTSFWELFNWNDYPVSQPFDFSIPALTKFKGLGYTLAIATARVASVDHLERELETLGIRAYFDCVTTRDSHALDYRDKTPQITQILDTLKVEKERAVLVGDTPTDIIAARDNALKGAIGVLSGGILEKVLYKESPMWVSNNIESLSKQL